MGLAQNRCPQGHVVPVKTLASFLHPDLGTTSDQQVVSGQVALEAWKGAISAHGLLVSSRTALGAVGSD
jgi:hypothetical protein